QVERDVRDPSSRLHRLTRVARASSALWHARSPRSGDPAAGGSSFVGTAATHVRSPRLASLLRSPHPANTNSFTDTSLPSQRITVLLMCLPSLRTGPSGSWWQLQSRPELDPVNSEARSSM